MNAFLEDIQILLSKIEKKYGKEVLKKYLQDDKNLITAESIEYTDIKTKRNTILLLQKSFNNTLENELNSFDSIGIEFVGLKGLFLSTAYYHEGHRAFGDIDILVKSNDAREFYKGLKKLGYRIELKTMYDNPVLNMMLIPKFYMENTQTLMLVNKKNRIHIDMHSNLNITNAHFKKTDTQFNTEKMFDNSIIFESYKNIRQLEMHDNICFLIRHLMKHHIFYGKTQSGLSTPIQHVLDIAYIINSDGFIIEKFYKKIHEYNILPEAIFCLNLYNKLFEHSGIRINLEPLIRDYREQNSTFRWKPILDAALNMDIESIMIGDFSTLFPKLQKIISLSERMNPIMDYVTQAFLINPFVKRLLK